MIIKKVSDWLFAEVIKTTTDDKSYLMKTVGPTTTLYELRFFGLIKKKLPIEDIDEMWKLIEEQWNRR